MSPSISVEDTYVRGRNAPTWLRQQGVVGCLIYDGGMSRRRLIGILRDMAARALVDEGVPSWRDLEWWVEPLGRGAGCLWLRRGADR